MRFFLLSAIFVITAFFAISLTAPPKKAEIKPSIKTPPAVSENADQPPPAPEVTEEKPPAVTVGVLNPKIETGETLVAEFSEAPTAVFFDGKEVKPFSYQESFRALIPLSLGTKTGNYVLKANFKNSTSVEEIISLSEKRQKIIILPPPPQLGLSDKQIVQNLSTSNTDLRKVVAEVEEITRFAEEFSLPVDDSFLISSPFGEVRRTGEESITHLGTDFDVPKGTAVKAINSGKVEKAYVDSIYGNSVIINHGWGIYSLYLHLDSMKVSAGNSVEKGQVVGLSGNSGLSSAPHLHLSLKINGASVDPIQFINTFK